MKMPESPFKQIVKEKSILASINYLNTKQSMAEKGIEIKYESMELQDYLSPYSNLSLEEKYKIFSLRTRMTH
jgi:hypothetical protein